MIDVAKSLKLYLVADPEHARGDFFGSVEAALQGGVTLVQLRAKKLTDRELLEHASLLRDMCSRHGAVFVVNDRVDIALATGADGVHLGVDDMPLEAARRLGSPGFLIGYSPETDQQIRSAGGRGADYLGIGPVFGTSSKSDAGEALGLTEFARRLELGELPAVGIGGITSANARSVLEAGASGIAVISALLGAINPAEAARQLSRNS